jgi:choline-phosphate cytidylyltransferase
MTVESSASELPPSTLPSPVQSHAYPKRTLHSKRSFHKHGPGALGGGSVDSPAYDASEEDNDPTTDDGASSVAPVAARRSNANTHSSVKNGIMQKKYQSVVAVDVDDSGVDSPTYDGDIESYTAPHPHNLSSHHEQHSSSENTASTLTSPISRHVVLSPASDTGSVHHPSSAFTPATPSPLAKGQFSFGSAPKFDPATITPSEIQSWVQKVVAGHNEDIPRYYKINPPPEGRPIVIYADGEPHCLLVLLSKQQSISQVCMICSIMGAP